MRGASPRVCKILAAVVIVAGVGSLLSPRASAAFKHLQEGMTVPKISGSDLRSGDPVSSDLRDGEVLIVTFWATWSERSLEILGDLKEMHGEYADLPLRIIAVNVENDVVSAEMRREIESEVESRDLPFPVTLDPGLELFRSYGVVAIPSTAVVDSDGILRYAPAGYSHTVRDHLVDSTRVLLGLDAPTDAIALDRGYVPDRKASRFFHLALQLKGQRMHERALAQLDRASAADSGFAAPSTLRGQLLLELGRPDDAIIAFEHAVALAGTSVASWTGWGQALFVAGRTAEAGEKLTTALEMDPTYTPALIERARWLIDAGEAVRALDLSQAALDLNPRDAEAHFVRGQSFEATGSVAEALSAYRAALEIHYPAP